MALNIKDKETYELVKELATLKGASLTSTVKEAVQNEIEREKVARENNTPGKGMAEWLMKIARETGPMLDDGRSSKELMDELYDDRTGLPK
jgi:hypothetical protein